MNPLTINNELSIEYPDGFHVTSEEETRRFFTTTKNRLSIYDENRHILMSVAWTKPGLLSYLTDAKTILAQAESGMRKGLRNYCELSRFTAPIAGKKAQGVRFSFTASDADVEQRGVMTVFRAGNKFYATTFVTREEDADGGEAVYNAISQSFTLTAK